MDYNMTRKRYEIAGYKVVMTTYFQRTRRKAEAYRAQTEWSEDEADIIIDYEPEYLENVQKKSKMKLSLEDWEYLYTGEVFHRRVVKKNGCMIHSSAVAVDGYAYLFSADSGTGKSTHTALWKQYLGEKAVILNDDKPIVRRKGELWYVFGTPWSGKTDLQVNDCAKLGGIVFLKRTEKNTIKEISVGEAIPKYLKQTIHQVSKEETMDLILTQMEQILVETPLYEMGCNISEEAASLAYHTIRRV